MILIYEPEGEDAQRYDIDDLTAREAVEVEQAVGLDWDEIETELKAQKPGSLLATLWVFRRRAEPGLEREGFDVPGWRRRLRVRLTADEVREHVDDVLVQFPDEADPTRAHLLSLLRKVAENAGDVDAAVGGQGPKGRRVRAA